jgi:hypothetical protein
MGVKIFMVKIVKVLIILFWLSYLIIKEQAY